MDNAIISVVFFLALFFSIRLVAEIIAQILLFTATRKCSISAFLMFLTASFWSAFYQLINQ